jgi:hypothetical protein
MNGVGLSGAPANLSLNLGPSGLPIYAPFPLQVTIPTSPPAAPSTGQFWSGATGPSGTFVPLLQGVAGAFPIKQGQLNNISNDILRISTLESAGQAENVPAGLQFNFGNVDLSQYTVCGATLANNPFKLYTEK